MADEKRVSIRTLNRVLKAGERRAEELEPRLVDILQPILSDAGVTAARNFRKHATDHLTASLLRRDVEHVAALGRAKIREMLPSLVLTAAAGRDRSGSNSTMIAVKPLPEEAERIALVDGIDPDELHVTLAYLGQYDGDLDELADALGEVARSHAPLQGRVGGVGSFDDNGSGYPAILLPSVPGLIELRVAVTEALVEAGLDYGRQHGYLPHLTVSYEDAEMIFPARDGLGQELHFDDLWVVRGDTDVRRVPLDGMTPITAAGEPTPWTSPAPNELLDVAALAQTLRGKTDPVRVGAIEAIMTPILEAAGLSFDVTNPLAEEVLSQSASQITEIADTTQVNVMRIIRTAHDEGLSIPATAEAIQQGMAEASTARAELIARTELVGAVNGGSLAATRIVAEETDLAYDKVWLTAPGAPNPRHELYEGLDGQTTTLDGFFQVGGDELQFPGDPSGSPDEVCNCRCTMIYQERAAKPEAPQSVDEGLESVENGGLSGITDSAIPETAEEGQRIVTLRPSGLSIIDDVSTGAGAPIEDYSLQRVKELGLDHSPEMLPESRQAFFAKYGAESTDRLTTELLYKVDPVWNPAARRYDGVWSEERQALHQQIISDWFKDHVPPPAGTPLHFYFTAGGGASGKGGARFLIEREGRTIEVRLEDLRDPSSEFFDPGTIVIDPDLLKAKLPEYQRMREIYDPSAAAAVHEESSDLAKEITRIATTPDELGRRYNVGLDSTGSGSKFITKIQAAKDEGYETQVTLVSTPTNLAIDRSIVRAEDAESSSYGRYVQVDPLKAAHRDSSAALELWQHDPVIDRYRVFDNKDGMKLAAEGKSGVQTIREPDLFQSILDKGREPDPFAAPVERPSFPTVMPAPPKLSRAEMYDQIRGAESDRRKFTQAQIEPVSDIVSKIHPDDQPGGRPSIEISSGGEVRIESAGKVWDVATDGTVTNVTSRYSPAMVEKQQEIWKGVMQERFDYAPRVLPTPESIGARVEELTPSGYAKFEKDASALVSKNAEQEPWQEMVADINEAVKEGYLNQDGATDTIFVARDASGKMIGVIAVQEGAETVAAWTVSAQEVPVGRYLSVMRLGAVPGAPPGTGSMLMRQATQIAAQRGLSVNGASVDSAATFYARIGMHVNTGLRGRLDPPIWWTKEEAARVANGEGIVRELPNAETIKSLTGVEFRSAEREIDVSARPADVDASFGQAATDALEKDGGFSFDVTGKPAITERYISAVSPDHEIVVGVGSDIHSVLTTYHAEKSRLAREKGLFFGGWKDAETGKVYLDLSTSFRDREEALRYAGSQGQIAIWDAVENKEIRVPKKYLPKPEAATAAATDVAEISDAPETFRDLPYDKQVERMRVMYANVEVKTGELSDFETGELSDFERVAKIIATGPLLPIGLDAHGFGEFVEALRRVSNRDDLSEENAKLFDLAVSMTPPLPLWSPRALPASKEAKRIDPLPAPPLGWFSDVDWSDAILDGPGPEYESGKQLYRPTPAEEPGSG